MHSRERPLGGWSVVLDSEEEGGFGEEAKTDPHIVPGDDFSFDDPPTTRSAMPDFAATHPGVPAEKPKPAPAARKLKLPVPGAASKAAASDEEPAAPPLASKPLAPPPAEVANFSPDDLVDKFQEPVHAAPKAKSGFREYRDLIVTAIAGVVVLTGVITYQVMKPHDPAPEQAPLAQAAQPAAAVEPPKPKAVGSIETEPAQPQQPVQPASMIPSGTVEPARPAQDAKTQRSKTPMVTIVSTPPGALIEINGTLYGNTPLIMPSPAATDRLEVRLKLNKYKTWEGNVGANEAGHFSVNVKLERVR